MTRGETRVATRPPAAKAPGTKLNIRTWPDLDCNVTALPRSPITRPVNPEARWTTPSPATASTSGCRLASARALSRGSATTSAQGSGVRLTATTVPDDQLRRADGRARLNEHSGSRSPVDCQWALMGVGCSCRHTPGSHLLTHPETSVVADGLVDLEVGRLTDTVVRP